MCFYYFLAFDRAASVQQVFCHSLPCGDTQPKLCGDLFEELLLELKRAEETFRASTNFPGQVADSVHCVRSDFDPAKNYVSIVDNASPRFLMNGTAKTARGTRSGQNQRLLSMWSVSQIKPRSSPAAHCGNKGHEAGRFGYPQKQTLLLKNQESKITYRTLPARIACSE
jgi:hypothetical protein